MTDAEAIERTVRDYFEGWFDGDAGRMERALHPALAKRALGADALDEDTAATMIQATAEGHGRRNDPDERRIEVDVVDVHGQIATSSYTRPSTVSTSISDEPTRAGRS